MAKTPSTRILCNADALARAADAILARGEKLSKNAILNTLARAIAGPGHDWGFLKNAPDGRYAQPGLPPETAGAPEKPSSAWVVFYDERSDWVPYAPRLFPSKPAALKAIAGDHKWWRHADHPFEKVMAQLADTGEYTFEPDQDNPDRMDDYEPYQIWLQEAEIEPDLPAGPEAAPSDTGPGAPCATRILFDAPWGSHHRQGFDWGEVIFKDEKDLEAYVEKNGLDPEGDWREDLFLARDCRFAATFRPQAWSNDYAVEVDPEGETEWQVEAGELQPDRFDLDYLQASLNAPAWVRDWSGPFEIELEVGKPEGSH